MIKTVTKKCDILTDIICILMSYLKNIHKIVHIQFSTYTNTNRNSSSFVVDGMQ